MATQVVKCNHVNDEASRHAWNVAGDAGMAAFYASADVPSNRAAFMAAVYAADDANRIGYYRKYLEWLK